MLTLIGIHVTHQSRDESLFYKTNTHVAWHRYDNELAFYASIANSPFHIIYNDGEIDEEIGLQIAYAMLKNRPILMTGAPVLSDDLSLFTREVITRHLHSIHSINLPNLELTELSRLLSTLKTTNYSLSKNEKYSSMRGSKRIFVSCLKTPSNYAWLKAAVRSGLLKKT